LKLVDPVVHRGNGSGWRLDSPVAFTAQNVAQNPRVEECLSFGH
jgi:hypothetical protein